MTASSHVNDAAQAPRGRNVRAGCAAEAQVDASGEQRFERPELLRHHEGRVVRQHDAPRSHADRAGACGEVADDDRRRRARDAGHVVMLGDPVAEIAEPLGVPREIERAAQGGRRVRALGDGRQVENGEGDHASILTAEGTEIGRRSRLRTVPALSPPRRFYAARPRRPRRPSRKSPFGRTPGSGALADERGGARTPSPKLCPRCAWSCRLRRLASSAMTKRLVPDLNRLDLSSECARPRHAHRRVSPPSSTATRLRSSSPRPSGMTAERRTL